MAVVSCEIRARAEDVFDVLVDPTTYPDWLVGAKEIRSVDDGWPVPGTRFHHRVGLAGPLTIADSTKVLAVDRPRSLALEVRAKPLGRGRATFRVEGPDEGPVTVELDEVPLGALAILRPLLDPLAAVRNKRSLDLLAERFEAS